MNMKISRCREYQWELLMHLSDIRSHGNVKGHEDIYKLEVSTSRCQLLRLEQQNCAVAQIEIDEVLRLCRSWSVEKFKIN